MQLIQTIDRDLIESLRQRQQERTAVLRMLKSTIKNFAIDKRLRESDVNDEQVIGLMRQEVRKRKESVEAFTKGGRPELAAKEQSEIQLIELYLPAAMPVEDIRKAIDEVVAEQGLTPPYQFGSFMGLVVKKIAGKAEGTTIRDEVQKYIATKT